MSLNDDQKYMMSFVWINPKELYVLETFPEAIMINTMEKQITRNDHHLQQVAKIQMVICSFFSSYHPQSTKFDV